MLSVRATRMPTIEAATLTSAVRRVRSLNSRTTNLAEAFRKREADRAAQDIAIGVKLLTLGELKPQECRWPIVGPEGIRFCGHTANGTYCEAHSLRAHGGA